MQGGSSLNTMSRRFTKRCFSTVNLRSEQHKSFEKISITQNIKDTRDINDINNNPNNNQNKNPNSNKYTALLEHPLYKKLQGKTLETGSKLNSFARGPLRLNLLVSLELVKLISAEQRLVPALSTWPQAKDSYLATFQTVKDAWDQNRVNWESFKMFLQEITWGQVGRALRIVAEMASFYYVGELIGMIISYPFK